VLGWVVAAVLCAGLAAAEGPDALKHLAELGDDEAYGKLCRLADGGDPRAQNVLGELYQHGGGGGEGKARALEWYAKAAEQDYVPAQHNLGMLFLGRGGSSEALARQWFAKAAERGYAPSQLQLASLCTTGRAGARDYVEGHKWLSVAAARLEGAERDRIERLREALEARMRAEDLAVARDQARLWLETHASGRP
jgi:TPR repeat protein